MTLQSSSQQGCSVGSEGVVEEQRGMKGQRPEIAPKKEGGVLSSTAAGGKAKGESSSSPSAAELGGVIVECPICLKQMVSRENDLGVLLHVEHCIQRSERRPSS